jgi:hypothetical protein
MRAVDSFTVSRGGKTGLRQLHQPPDAVVGIGEVARPLAPFFGRSGREDRAPLVLVEDLQQLVGERRAERAEEVGDLRVGNVLDPRRGLLGREVRDLLDERRKRSGGGRSGTVRIGSCHLSWSAARGDHGTGVPGA